MGDDDDFKEYVKEQFAHGQRHFERIEEGFDGLREIVGGHASTLSSLNEGVLEGANERAAYVDAMMKRSKFWDDLRDELTRKGVMVVCLCLIAGVAFYLGFEDVARKIIGID